MATHSYRRNDCRLCGSTQRTLALQLVPTPIGEGYVPTARLEEPQACHPMDLMLCHQCGHAEFADVLDPAILYRHYLYQTSISLGLVEHFRGYVDDAVNRLGLAPGSLALDIGSNDGSLLRFFQNHGLKVLGVDPALDIARQATNNGIETWAEFFTADLARKIRTERGPAAVVTANNVFANIDNLANVAAGIREVLAPDGVFLFETSYLADVLRKELLETFFHEHLCYFSVSPLATFFQRNGMELFDVQHVATKGGSIRGFVQLAGAGRPVSPAVAAAIQAEKELGLDRPEVYRAFADRMRAVRDGLARRLDACRAEGKVVAGYGASVGVTTLLYQFDLGGRLDFLVDDNPVRHGLHSPGHHLPVLPSAALYERKADVVVVLAWAYFEAIRKRHPQFLERGGQWIVPLPKVTAC